MISSLSVVIPVARGELSWTRLLDDLVGDLADDLAENWVNEPLNTQITIVSPEQSHSSLSKKVKWVTSPVGRAVQLNVGARESQGEFIWFLHADSRVSKTTLKELKKVKNLNTLYYFNLRFYDGSRLMRLNELGVWIRSHCFGIPFGDQGFLLSRELFERLGGFDEAAPHSEDHLMVWKAKRLGARLECLGETLGTSARKYEEFGWSKTTLNHLKLTIGQAIPEWKNLLNERAK